MSTHNLCFEKKYEKDQNFLCEKLPFLVVKFSVYLNRHVFVMNDIFPILTGTHVAVILLYAVHFYA